MFEESEEYNIQRKGWIEVITGSMFSGKTEELLRRLRRAALAKQSVSVYKPAIDTRYSSSNVVSHDSQSVECRQVASAHQIAKELSDKHVDVIGIDEAQFFGSELPAVCESLANNGSRVIVAGLDMDFLGKPFGSMPEMMASAEYVTKVHAICQRCGAPAIYSHRTSSSKDLYLLGEKDIYEPLCRSCYRQAQAKHSELKTQENESNTI